MNQVDTYMDVNNRSVRTKPKGRVNEKSGVG